jgi:hypothetical protein
MIDNISQATLDVIEAIRKKIPVKFTYMDLTRIVNPTGFYGDFYGFEGTYAEDETQHRRFSFDKVDDWQGVVLPYTVFVEINMYDYPTDEEVRSYLEPIADGMDPLVYRIKPRVV